MNDEADDAPAGIVVNGIEVVSADEPSRDTQASDAELHQRRMRSKGTASILDRSRFARPDAPPATVRELIAVISLVVVSDLTLFRGEGLAGYAVLLVVASLLIGVGAATRGGGRFVWITLAMLELLAARMVWNGSIAHFAVGLFLLAAFACAQSGRKPFVLDVLGFASQTILSGIYFVEHHARAFKDSKFPVTQPLVLSVLFPVAAFIAFGLIFLLANPDLFTLFSERMEFVLTALHDWFARFSLAEITFWVVSFFVSAGLLRPLASGAEDEEPRIPIEPNVDDPALFYSAFRNTLLTLIGLFIAYLVFEFRTLWFREFPQGFHFSGYAHEGAAWLTIALGLATLVLSMIFRGQILRDGRLPQLRRLAWVWASLNLFLALAVYHRLMIYVGFNGMSRMRVVGFFGISTVVIGFVLVVFKIVQRRHFAWLIRRQLWALGLATYFYLLIPVDTFVVAYNVRRILDGDPAPAVQISVHPISAEGVLLLRPLLESKDEFIREGVGAILALRDRKAERAIENQRALGWTAYQLADELVHEKLRDSRNDWKEYFDDAYEQGVALKRFHKYAYQWY